MIVMSVWSLFAVNMFESTSLLFYTLFYIIVSACFVLRTTEFVSNGVTVENLFETVIDKEYNNFIMHHIKRTSYTIIAHSCLPFGWFATLMYPIPTNFLAASESGPKLNLNTVGSLILQFIVILVWWGFLVLL